MSIRGYIYKEGDDFYLGRKNTQKKKTGWGIMLYSYLDKDKDKDQGWFVKMKKSNSDVNQTKQEFNDTDLMLFFEYAVPETITNLQSNPFYINNDKTNNYYYGYWKDDKRYASDMTVGIMTYKNGDVYNGAWNNDKRNGKGKMTYENGDFYHGIWKNDERNGKGKMTYKNGDVYNGTWENDKRHGEGIMTYKNGDAWNGNWENDLQTIGVTISNEIVLDLKKDRKIERTPPDSKIPPYAKYEIPQKLEPWLKSKPKSKSKSNSKSKSKSPPAWGGKSTRKNRKRNSK